MPNSTLPDPNWQTLPYNPPSGTIPQSNDPANPNLIGVRGDPTRQTLPWSPYTGPVSPAGNEQANPGSLSSRAAPDSNVNLTDFQAKLQGMFPWISSIGLSLAQIQGWAVQLLTGDSLVAAIRQTPQYQARFPAMRRPDGSLRMTEAQYLTTEDDYRKVLKQWNQGNDTFDQPWEVAAFFDNEIDPNELGKRFEVYDTVKRNRDVQDAFYVYAGMRPTVDDLYTATVNPEANQRLQDEYNQRVAATAPDYQAWITRATEAGLSRVVDTLADLQKNGIITGAAISRIQAVAPDFARQMMDVLYHGGGTGTATLNLNELMHSFEFAMIGSSATQNGLSLPDKDRIEAIRQAGVDRAKALEAYGQYAGQRNLLSGAVQRAHLAERFTQDDFERAVLLHEGPASSLLQQSQASEEALSKGSGGPSFNQDKAGRLVQSGLRVTGV